jgi:hypothetical protein
MISFEQCRDFAGLAQNEMVLGSTASAMHDSLLSSYILNMESGPTVVRRMMVADIRSSLDLGALKQASDLLIVLRRFLSNHPEARLVPFRAIYQS